MENLLPIDAFFAYLEHNEQQKIREPCEQKLVNFVKYIWPVIEPSRDFMSGWVVEAICDHLQAVTDGHIRRLLINVPPGFTKSTLVGVMWPAWEWGPRSMPSTRYICASYSEHLSVRDNMRCKNIVMSDRYQDLWKDRFQVAPDLMSKIKFGNNKTGWKLATSVGGVGVGERGDRFIIDDPHNTMDMESEAARDTTKMWFTEVVPDRLNNQEKSAIVIIMQRLHEDDVSGTAISRNMGYTHLMVPMYHDTGRHCRTYWGFKAGEDEEGPYSWTDPRTEEGELAWPERFPQYICSELERDKGPYAWASQYQQSPEPRGGSIIKRDYWKMWGEPFYPNCEYILASLDTAYTTKESNDPSALTIWGVYREEHDTVVNGRIIKVKGDTKVMLLYAWTKRLEFNELVQQVIDTCTKDSRKIPGPRFNVDRVIVEAKASGISVAQELRRLCSLDGKFGVELVKLKGSMDKVARLHSVQHLFAEGMVYAPGYPDTGMWREFSGMVIDEISIFPHGSHDDLVDSTSMAMRYLRDNGFMVRSEEKELDENEEMMYRGPGMPLYPV